jgi:hypothetical protein
MDRLQHYELFFDSEIKMDTPNGRLNNLSMLNSQLNMRYNMRLIKPSYVWRVASEPAPFLIILSGIILLNNLKIAMGINNIVLKKVVLTVSKSDFLTKSFKLLRVYRLK